MTSNQRWERLKSISYKYKVEVFSYDRERESW